MEDSHFTDGKMRAQREVGTCIRPGHKSTEAVGSVYMSNPQNSAEWPNCTHKTSDVGNMSADGATLRPSR